MSSYQYKCLKCQERHERQVGDRDLEDTYFAPCPICGYVSRRVADYPVDDELGLIDHDSVSLTVN